MTASAVLAGNKKPSKQCVIMETDKIFTVLDSEKAATSEKCALLVTYLHEKLERYLADPARGEWVAYEVAGLFSTAFARELEEGDVIEEILYTAGQLELPEAHRDPGASWEKMAQLVNFLPSD